MDFFGLGGRSDETRATLGNNSDEFRSHRGIMLPQLPLGASVVYLGAAKTSSIILNFFVGLLSFYTVPRRALILQTQVQHAVCFLGGRLSCRSCRPITVISGTAMFGVQSDTVCRDHMHTDMKTMPVCFDACYSFFSCGKTRRGKTQMIGKPVN
ncbi:hypothetical protein F5887DRAFT_106980 [Amanita rubescens]|nr:hypothetical protein F5887DRAFT_106980 [Amanita rubescens]